MSLNDYLGRHRSKERQKADYKEIEKARQAGYKKASSMSRQGYKVGAHLYSYLDNGGDPYIALASAIFTGALQEIIKLGNVSKSNQIKNTQVVEPLLWVLTNPISLNLCDQLGLDVHHILRRLYRGQLKQVEESK